MYSVTEGFTNGILLNRYIDYTASIGSLDMKTDAILQSISIDRQNQSNSSIIGNAVPVCVKIKLSGIDSDYNFIGEEVLIALGMKVGSIFEYVPFAPMKVYEQAFSQETKAWDLTCYDMLYEANNKSIQDITFTYPITYKDYIETVCTEIGISLGSTDFLNYDVVLVSAPNFDGTETLRYVIAAFAESILCNAVIGREKDLSGKSVLYFKPILNTSSAFAIGTKYSKCTLGEKYGKLNSLVLSRTAQEDNVYKRNEASITADGLTELIISNNPFLDYGSSEDTRYDIIDSLYNAIIGDLIESEVVVGTLHDLTLYPYTLAYRCNWALDQYDNISVVDTDGTTVHTLIYPGDKITYSGGITATVDFNVKSQNQVDYQKASNLKSVVKNTYLRVDKVEQEITAVVSNVNTITENITTIQQDVTSITATVSNIGGENLILNSSGIGGLDQWVHGETDSITTGYDFESAARARFELTSGSLTQSIAVVSTTEYTFSFKYKKNAASTLTVSLNGEIVMSATDAATSYIQSSHTITASSGNIEIVISCDESYAYITEMLLSASGSTVWSQAANEIYTTGVSITKDGIEIAQSGSKTIQTIDSSGSRILKETNNEIVSSYTDEGGYMSNLEVGYKVKVGNFIDFAPNDSTYTHTFIRR
jgi:hypothetical protein